VRLNAFYVASCLSTLNCQIEAPENLIADLYQALDRI
jgi:hypothetical protein